MTHIDKNSIKHVLVCFLLSLIGAVIIFDSNYVSDADTFKAANVDIEVIYELATPTTELVDVPQIAEAESYTCEISQGGKAVEWSSFITNSE